MAHALLRELAGRGHTVEVLITEPTDVPAPYEVDGVSVFPRTGKGDPFCWFESAKHRPDLVVTHLGSTERATILARRYGCGVVHIQHNELVEQLTASAEHPPDVQVYNTHWVKDAHERWLASRGRSVPVPAVVHPPVWPEKCSTTTGQAVTLVNLFERKGSAVFWELASRFPDREFLGVKGGYGEQDVRSADNVTVLEHGADMREVYSRTKVLLAPSVYESYGLVAAEATCSGIPVIAHPTPGLVECLENSGVFCDRDDVDAWEKALRKLLSPRGWSAASKRAKDRASTLDSSDDLARWCEIAERVGRRGRACVFG